MFLFLTIYLVGYGGMNAYVVWKVARGLGGGRWVWLSTALLSLLLLLAPIIAHRLVAFRQFNSARVLALAGYLWMAMVMWMLFLGVLTDLWNAVMRMSGAFSPSLRGWILAPTPALKVYAVVVLLLLLWGAVEGRQLRVVETHIRSPRIPAGAAPVRIVQISDTHVGLTQGADVFRKIMSKVQAARPDMLVCTGDLLDAESPRSQECRDLLAGLTPPLGKFAVTGNHEFYAGIDSSIELMESAGLEVLRGQFMPVNSWLTVAGVDDPAGLDRGFGGAKVDEQALFAQVDSAPFVLFLKHRPLLSDHAAGRVQLQLSGHTHGGQIFPFHLALPFFYPLGHGLMRPERDCRVYVSRGSGNWGPPLRVLAPREITVFVLEHGTSDMVRGD